MSRCLSVLLSQRAASGSQRTDFELCEGTTPDPFRTLFTSRRMIFSHINKYLRGAASPTAGAIYTAAHCKDWI